MTRLDMGTLCGLFVIGSFLGWIVESTFRTIRERRGFINSGLLKGPVIPIYGFGAVAICVVDDAVKSCPVPIAALVRILALTLVCTALEYFVGFLFEAAFKVRLWDYSKNRFNLRGRICLSHALMWALLSIVFIGCIRPVAERGIELLLARPGAVWVLAILCAAMALDAGTSMLALANISTFIGKLRTLTDHFELAGLSNAAARVRRRLFSAFPELVRAIADTMAKNLMARSEQEGEAGNITKALSAIRHKPTAFDDIDDTVFLSAVHDLAGDSSVQGMASIMHHDASTLQHSLTVSLASYYLAKAFGLDETSAARGALLHDFHLYDWRDRRHSRHSTRHARIALRNARARFQLNPIEEDVIATHMWPLASSFYGYKESFVVSSIDKIVTTGEVARMLRSSLRTR